MIRKLLKQLPLRLQYHIRRFRESPSHKRWRALRVQVLIVSSVSTETVWFAVEKVNSRRLLSDHKPTKLEVDQWIHVYYS